MGPTLARNLELKVQMGARGRWRHGTDQLALFYALAFAYVNAARGRTRSYGHPGAADLHHVAVPILLAGEERLHHPRCVRAYLWGAVIHAQSAHASFTKNRMEAHGKAGCHGEEASRGGQKAHVSLLRPVLSVGTLAAWLLEPDGVVVGCNPC